MMQNTSTSTEIFNELEEKSIGELIGKLVEHQRVVDNIEDVTTIYARIDYYLHHAVEALDCCTRLLFYAKENYIQLESKANMEWGRNFESYIPDTPISLVRGRADASVVLLRYQADLAKLQVERFEQYRELYLEKVNFFKKIKGGIIDGQ